MEYINIREYLYHGIKGNNAVSVSENNNIAALYIFESILKTGYLVNNIESRKYNVNSKNNIYADMGYSPRISLGFYPLDQETFSLSKRLHPDYYEKNIIDKIIKDHNITEEVADEFIMHCFNLNQGCSSEDYAWCSYYIGSITLLLNKSVLKDLKISNYGMLVDEICIDEPIELSEYLEYVAIGNLDFLDLVKQLLEKYDYDIPIIEFPSGKLLTEKILHK